MEVIIYSLSSVFQVLLILLLLLAITRRPNKQLSLPPGPKTFPYLGCLPQMLLNKPVFRWIHKFMDDMNTEFACFRFGNTHVFVVSDPALACTFLEKEDAQVSSRPISMSADIMSGGYLTAALSPLGKQSRKMKNIISRQLLSPARHRWLENKRVEEADNLVYYLYNQCRNGGFVNLRVATQHYSGNVTRKMIFGKRLFGKGMKDGGPGAEEEEHVGSIMTLLEYLNSFCVSDYLPFLRGFDVDGHEKIMSKAVGNVRKHQDPLIDERIKQWKDGSRIKEEDWLDVMICLKDSNGNSLLSVEEIKAQLLVS